MSPEAATRRLLKALRVEIQLRELSLREVSRRLGRGDDYLSQILRGRPELKVKQLFAVLQAMETPPGRFLLSLFLEELLAELRPGTGDLLGQWVRQALTARARDPLVYSEHPPDSEPGSSRRGGTG